MESRRRAIPGDLGAAARARQASLPGLSFEEAWDLVEAEALPFMRKGETVGMALIRARQQKPELPTLDFEEWFADVQKRQKERKAHVEAIEEHVEAIEWQPGKRLLIRGSEAFFVD